MPARPRNAKLAREVAPLHKSLGRATSEHACCKGVAKARGSAPPHERWQLRARGTVGRAGMCGQPSQSSPALTAPTSGRAGETTLQPRALVRAPAGGAFPTPLVHDWTRTIIRIRRPAKCQPFGAGRCRIEDRVVSACAGHRCRINHECRHIKHVHVLWTGCRKTDPKGASDHMHRARDFGEKFLAWPSNRALYRTKLSTYTLRCQASGKTSAG